MKKIAVIGSGIGGLTTAAILSSSGYDVEVFEKTGSVGGKMNEFSKDGYRFDTGPSLVTMRYVLEELFDRCGKKLEDYIDLVPVNPVCRYFWNDGTTFDCFTDLPAVLDEIKRIAPEDAESYVKFLGYSADIYQKTAQTFLFNPLQKISDLKKLKKSDFFKIDPFSSVSSRVDKFFDSKYLQQVFKRFTTYNGSSPYIAPATLNVIAYVELCEGGYYIKGGLYKFANALKDICEENGVKLHFNSEIKQINAPDLTASSITLENGNTFPFDFIFSNADATHTYTKLLDKDIVKPKHRNQFKKVEPSCSGFVLMLGIDKKYDMLKHHNIFFSEDYENEFIEIFLRKKLPTDPTIYIANTSFTDAEHAPEGGSNLFILVNSPYLSPKQKWDNEIVESYNNLIIKRLEEHGLDGLSESIKVKKNITPIDFEKKYLSNRGSIYGTSSNQTFSAFLRPRNKSPFVSNLYMCGGSTHPGGGIPLVVLSAFHAVDLFGKDLKL